MEKTETYMNNIKVSEFIRRVSIVSFDCVSAARVLSSHIKIEYVQFEFRT